MLLKKCDNCGNDNFDINEFIIHRASLENGILEVYKNKGNEIETIMCTKCKKEFSISDFKEIIF